MSWAIRELRQMWDQTLGEPIDSFEALLSRIDELEPTPARSGGEVTGKAQAPSMPSTGFSRNPPAAPSAQSHNLSGSVSTPWNQRSSQ
jgi:hypothetical protein